VASEAVQKEGKTVRRESTLGHYLPTDQCLGHRFAAFSDCFFMTLVNIVG
jgi:hypothetical protein